jgi:hypothetical protein
LYGLVETKKCTASRLFSFDRSYLSFLNEKIVFSKNNNEEIVLKTPNRVILKKNLGFTSLKIIEDLDRFNKFSPFTGFSTVDSIPMSVLLSIDKGIAKEVFKTNLEIVLYRSSNKFLPLIKNRLDGISVESKVAFIMDTVLQNIRLSDDEIEGFPKYLVSFKYLSREELENLLTTVFFKIRRTSRFG